MANKPNSANSASNAEKEESKRISLPQTEPTLPPTPAASSDTKRTRLASTSVYPMLAVLIDPVEMSTFEAARFRSEFPTVVSIEVPAEKAKATTVTNVGGHRFAATTEDDLDRVTCKITAMYFRASFAVINFNRDCDARAKVVLSALEGIAGKENVVYFASPEAALARSTEA